MAEFDAYSDSYTQAIRDATAFVGQQPEGFTRRKTDALIDLVRRRLGELHKTRVLDVGCGPGETDRVLGDRFLELHGVDVSSEMVARAMETNPWATYASYAEASQLPYDEGDFDLAFAICVFHHVAPAGRAHLMREMVRVTRPGGLVVIFEHNPLNPLTRKVVRNCVFDKDAILLGRREVSGLFRETDLDPVESRYILFVPSESPRTRAVERSLAWLPLGAQYYAAARKPENARARQAAPEPPGSRPM